MRRPIEVLHPNGPNDIALECVVDIALRHELEGTAEGIEVPVAVQHVRTVLLRAARRSTGEVVASVRRLVVDPGTRRQQVAYRRFLLLIGQATNVVHTQLREGFVEIDDTTA